MSVPLSRPYPCVYGAPVLDRVDPRIFQFRYFARCMDCTYCHDACCQYGADIEMPRVAAIEARKAELEEYLGVPADEWFRTHPEDIGVLKEPEYPGGEYTRTNFQELPPGRLAHADDWACVFLDPTGRGCRLHRFALERGVSVYEIKPLVCMLFPLSFDKGMLKPAYEFEVDDLICSGEGPTLYRSAREDARFYFGTELIAELDRLEADYAPYPPTPRRAIPLPVSS